MKLKNKRVVAYAIVLAAPLLLVCSSLAAGGGGLWLSGGQNRDNTRHQKAETKVDVENIADLVPRWVLTTGGDVSATPAVDGDAVYFPDSAGNLYKVDRNTGLLIWKKSIADHTGIPGNFSRATPAVYDNKLYLGDQGGRLFAGARMMAVDAQTGNLIWTTLVADHPAAIVTQSASVFDGVVYVGIASVEELFAAVIPGYECCSFRGRMVALDAYTGQILWVTYMAPEGYSGNSIWGSTPVVDARRKAIYVATGNNYSVPDEVSQCVIAAGDDQTAQIACSNPDNHFDSVVALDMYSGAIRWATGATPYDVWTFGCILNLPDCPEPAGPHHDFAQAPILYHDKWLKTDLLGVGQKSGRFWVLNADDGAVVWVTQAGPGGYLGGMMWGSAYDGERIYTAQANSESQSWTLVDGSVTTAGFWTALDPTTGEILWQTADPNGSVVMGAVTSANGLVFACSMDAQGHMYVLNGATGEILWSFASGGSCNAGAAVVNGTVFWGSGYATLGPPYTPGNAFYSFSLP